MSKRLVGVVALMLLLAGTLAAPALAVDAGGAATAPPQEEERPTIQELREQSGEVAEEFFPEPYEPPPFFRFILYPLLVVGVIVILAVLFRYLVWQPHFSREARERASSGRRR